MGTHLRKHVARRAYGARTSVRTHHRRRADRFTNLIYTSTHPPTHPSTQLNTTDLPRLHYPRGRLAHGGGAAPRAAGGRWCVGLYVFDWDSSIDGLSCWSLDYVGVLGCMSDRASRVDGMSYRACSMVSSAKARVVRPSDLTSTYHHHPRRQDPDPARRVDAGQAVQAILQQAAARHRVEVRVQSAD